jgi:transcriptional regulator with XRE-family HTH domain
MTVNDLKSTWGDRIRELREERGLSLNYLARVSEIGQSQLWKVEQGERGLSDDARIRLARALGVRVEEIFTYPDTSKAEVA